MQKKIKELCNKFLKEVEEKEVRIISHYDTDGITSAAIMARALQRLDKKFSLKIVKQLEEQTIKDLPQDKVLLFLDLGSGNLEQISELNTSIFILDHHEISEKVPNNLNIINPFLFDKEDISGAGLAYLFAKQISKENKDLSSLAIIGMVGDMLDQNLGKINNQILNDAEIVIKKGLLLYPATRPLNKALEFSSGIFIPGVTGNFRGAISLLKEANIEKENGQYKSLIELDEEEMSRLITAVLIRKAYRNIGENDEIIGNLYLIKFFNRLEDARELSAMINACSRLANSDIAFALCIGNKKARVEAEKIYAKYKQELLSALNYVSNCKKIEGKEYIIINAKNEIKDTITGTIASILSKSAIYSEGTIIITMAYDKEKIKVSERISGKGNHKNLYEILKSTISLVGGEYGGHPNAAGCLIPKSKEKEFISALKKNLEIELVKI